MAASGSIAIIGGTGFYDLGARIAGETMATPYGEAAWFRVEVAGRPVIFLTRHGAGHAVPPHKVNYRANIWALHTLGVREIVATQAVGSLHPAMAPGHFAILDQFIDWTKSRPSTFFDGGDAPVIHVDVTLPYCPRVSEGLRAAGAFLGDRLHTGAVYACTEGPRFETAAEVRALRILGADVVGMTNVPEVVLAREAGLCYASVSIVCNWAAGITDAPLTHEEVLGIMADQGQAVRQLVEHYVAASPAGNCACAGLGYGHLLPA